MSNDTSNDDVKGIARELKTHALILSIFVGLMWGVEIVDTVVFQGGLDLFGILPRHAIGLRGILLMPFLHANFPHLLANTVPFVTLGWLIMLRETRDFFFVTAIATVVGGLGVWLFGSPARHIGASGVVFGYLGFLLFRGLFERSFSSVALSLIVLFLYGGLIWGVLPGQPGISWEGHLFGLIGGVLAAKWLSRRKAA